MPFCSPTEICIDRNVNADTWWPRPMCILSINLYAFWTFVQPADIGLPTVNGNKLSCSQAQLGQATCLAVALFLSITCGPSYVCRLYSVVQLDFTPEIEVFYMLLERCHTKSRERSITQHMKYFNLWGKIKFDHPVKFSCLYWNI